MGDSQGEKETRGFAKARQRSHRDQELTVFLRASEACRLGQNHPSVRVRDCGNEVLGDRGKLEIITGGKVPLQRCRGGKYAACTILPSIERAGGSVPAPSARALPHLKEHVHT